MESNLAWNVFITKMTDNNITDHVSKILESICLSVD